MKTLVKYRMILLMSIAVISIGCQQKKSEKSKGLIPSANAQSIDRKKLTDPDKRLLIGQWSATRTPLLIKITGVDEIGKLEAEFYNPDKIDIELSNWTKVGTLLSVYIELKDHEFPGSNFRLNYIPERDVLVGKFYDALRNTTYPIEFIRIQ